MDRILLNSEKHHLGTISEKILALKDSGEQSLDFLLTALVLNTDNDRSYNGVVDVYEGPLSAQQIKEEILNFMRENQISDLDSYKRYIETQGQIKRRGHYFNRVLSDTSVFTLRLIDDPKVFVHIHPGRYSPNTFRVKANTLKTAIVTNFLAMCRQQSPYTLSLVNEARCKLELSPVDEKISSIYETIEKLNNCLARLQNISPIPRPESDKGKVWSQWWQKCLRWFGRKPAEESSFGKNDALHNNTNIAQVPNIPAEKNADITTYANIDEKVNDENGQKSVSDYADTIAKFEKKSPTIFQSDNTNDEKA